MCVILVHYTSKYLLCFVVPIGPPVIYVLLDSSKSVVRTKTGFLLFCFSSSVCSVTAQVVLVKWLVVKSRQFNDDNSGVGPLTGSYEVRPALLNTDSQ